MAEKQKRDIRVGGADIDGTSALASATSDAIEFKSSGYWSLNCWFTSLTTSGAAPTVTIQVSNDDDTNSFNDLDGAVGVSLPVMISKSDMEFKFMRIVYDPKTATGGSKYFDLITE
jgi:hypothetical protein